MRGRPDPVAGFFGKLQLGYMISCLMKNNFSMRWLVGMSLAVAIAACQQPPTATLYAQYPSPMADFTRPHHRIALDAVVQQGITVRLSDEIQGTLYLAEKWKNAPLAPLLIHFHGDYRVAQHAVDQQDTPWILFHAHWGNGSSAYARPVSEIGAAALLDSIGQAVRRFFPGTTFSDVYLSGWSAGYGAIRSLIQDCHTAGRIQGILLMDGLHCSYVPEQKRLAEGGILDSTQMQAFATWAQMAASKKKSFLITHSSVFPGTYASTTETADYLLQTLDIRRKPLLAEGPVGMQQTSVASSGRFQVLSFAGNSAPDHVDHYHGMEVLLRRLWELQ